jgi:hypothetical protein
MASLPGSARVLRALLTAMCLFSVAQACGGRSNTEDYQFGSDGTISVGATSSSAGRGSSVAGTSSVVGGSNGTGGTASTGATGNIGGTGVVTGGSGPIGRGGSAIGGTGIGGTGIGGTGTGGTGIGGTGIGGSGVAGSGTAGSAGSPPGPPITCGPQTCDSNTQSCCAGFGGLACIAKNKTCNGATLDCTTTSDCSGNDVCCISITGNANAASTCKPRCDNQGLGRDRQLCQTNADCLRPFRFCTATIFGVSICTRGP